MRFNLDPTSICTDEEMNQVLVDAELDKLILKKKEETEKEKKENRDKMGDKELIDNYLKK